MNNEELQKQNGRVQRLENNLATHEAVCAERWLEMLHRVKRIEHIMIGTAGATIILLISLVVKT